MKALVIAGVALRRLFRDRSNLFFVLVFPLLLVLLLGAAFGASGAQRVGIVGDPGDRLAERLTTALEQTDLVLVEVDDEDALRSDVARGFLSAGIVLPADLEAATLERPRSIPLVLRPDAGSLAARATIEGAVARESSRMVAVEVARELSGRDGEALLTAVDLARRGLADVAVSTSEVGTEDPLEAEFAGLGRFDLGASSQLFLFTFLTGLAGGAGLIEVRQLGVARRILGTPTSPRQQVLGTTGGRVLIALFQAAYIVAATVLLFGVDWGDPVATAAVVVLFCLVAGGAGTLLGAAMRTTSQASGVAVGLGLGAAALGGSMAPIELFPDALRTVAHVTPHAWANGAMAEIVRRDGGLLDVVPQLLALAGFAVVLLGLGSWQLRRVLTR